MEGIRLTSMTQSAGCAAKLGPGILANIISALPQNFDSNLLVGYDTSDDACVYKIDEKTALIQTVDFFPPVVDDPYLFGQIAAANALSDIYAMGGTPTLALNLLCVPTCLELDVVKAIMEGGYSKVKEAGAVVAGGHTIEDSNPKYGLCATGFVRLDSVWSNAGAKEGDVLILTKPLGAGIATTAAKADLLTVEQLRLATDNMAMLNKYSRDVFSAFPINACTDVTGFGLLGHSCEMAKASGVSLELDVSNIPVLPGILELAQMGIIPQGAYSNRAYLSDKVAFSDKVSEAYTDILFDPQTSGGLLVSINENLASDALNALTESGITAAVIGRVISRKSVSVQVI